MMLKYIAPAVALVITAAILPASANLVSNGSFEEDGGDGQIGFNTFVTGWNVSNPPYSYVMVFGPGAADTTGAWGQYCGGPPGSCGPVKLWGPGDGANNGMPATSPDGGSYIAMNGDFQTSPIFQTVDGLVAGRAYDVTFWWATSQQQYHYGDTQQSITVSLGSERYTTPTYLNPSEGFTGWYKGLAQFTAASTSETLSFLASGGGSEPNPPFALLDGVSMTPVPEPSTWVTMIVGFAALVCAGLRSASRGDRVLAHRELAGPLSSDAAE